MHNPYIRGTWGHQFRCMATEQNYDVRCCRVLGSDLRNRSLVAFYTVVDKTEWTDRKGVMHSHELSLFPAKFGTLTTLEEKRNERGTLIGNVFRARHNGAQHTPRVGNEHEFQGTVDMQELFSKACYRGRKLSELYDKAATSPDVLRRLQQLFKIEIGIDGRIIRKLVPFNYDWVVHVPSEREVAQLLAGYDPEALNRRDEQRTSPPSASNSYAPPSAKSRDNIPYDDIPF